MVEDEITRAKGELDTAAAESSQAGRDEAARHPGSEDPAPDQREAAREVGLDSANDIRVKKPAIANDLRSRLEGFSGEYSQYAETVNSRILETENVIVPALGEMAGRSSRTLKEGEAAALQAIENRASADLQSLDLLESAAVNSLRAASKTTIRQIRNTSRLAQEQVDAAITAIASEIDNIASGAGMAAEPTESGVAPTGEGQSSVQESTVAVEESVAAPDPLSQTMEAEKSFVQESRNSLHEAVATVNGILPTLTSSFSTGSSESVRASRLGADAIYQRLMPAINNLVMAGDQQDQSVVDSTRAQQESLMTSAASEVDSAEGQARGEVTGMNDTFHDELRDGANESIREAIKPRTDRVEDRAAEAAERAGESWVIGVFRAIGEIVVGLVILVAVALVVAGIAALFGVVLTAWGAIMIAGGILLAAGLIMSLVTRSQQQEFRDAGLGTQILVVAGDTLGLTNLVEGATGREVLTGRTLSASERAQRTTLGAFSAVMLVLGGRGLAKGPRPGFVRGPATGRPGLSLPRSWTQAKAGFAEGVRSVGGELYTGARQGLSNLVEWGRRQGERAGLRRPVAAEEPIQAPKPEQQPGEARADYMQRFREWNNRRLARQQYETTTDAAIGRARNEIENPINRRWWEQATERERRLAYDYAHEGVINDLGVNEARVGLTAERQSIVEGPIRRHQGLGVEFEDAAGIQWDVKSGRTPASNYADSLVQGENILVDRAGITDPQGALDEAGFANLLRDIARDLTSRGRVDIVPQINTRVRSVPPLTNLPMPPVVPTQPKTSEDESR
jgi:hypothetical protein